MKLYYNPRCNTCRMSLKLLQEKNVDVDIIKYLEEAPTIEDIEELVKILNISPIDLVRINEDVWKDNFEGKELSDKEIILAMAEYPILIQRPILINGNKAIIGRPVEKILDIV